MRDHFDPFDHGDFYDPYADPLAWARQRRAANCEIVGRRLLAQAHAPLSPRARERHAAALAAGLARLAAHGPAVAQRYSIALQGEHEEASQ